MPNDSISPATIEVVAVRAAPCAKALAMSRIAFTMAGDGVTVAGAEGVDGVGAEVGVPGAPFEVVLPSPAESPWSEADPSCSSSAGVSGSSRSSASVSTKFIRASSAHMICCIESRCSEIEEKVRMLRYVRLQKKKGRTYLAIFGNVVEIRGSYRRQL